MLHNVEVLHLL